MKHSIGLMSLLLCWQVLGLTSAERLEAIRAKLPEFGRSIENIKSAGQDTAYPRVTFTVLRNFVDYTADDLKLPDNKFVSKRAAMELDDLEKMSDRLAGLLESVKSGSTLPEVPRWTGKARPRIDGPSFIGPAAFPSHPGQAMDRPIFFIGYGHFAQVRNDIEKFPGYGVNIVQCGEWGPSRTYPKEGETDDAPLKQMIDMLDRGAKAGVAVDWLISPHYFPDWMFAKYPDLHVPRADFFPYSLYRPEPKELLKKFIKETVSKLKDKPALFSICLSNEPINVEAITPQSTAAFREWLRRRHSTIETLNVRWKTNYKSFDEIPQPNPMGKSDEPRPGGAWMDFVRWNNEYFSAFHKLLADAVHDAAPNIPVHIKATTWHMYRAEEVHTGDDPAGLCSVSDINGNDSVNLWNFGVREGDLIERGTEDFAQGWRENAIGYELERSAKNVPVFNSENHPIFDGEQRYVSPAHIRAMLWMGAIHGQGATTLWVWDRTTDPAHSFAGNIMDRPACAEALGIVSHDLNRVAPQITAIENLPPQVLILQSPTSAAWDGQTYGRTLVKLFTALSFTGVKVGFTTEGMLEKGKIPEAPLLMIPDATHLSSESRKALESFKGKVLFVGDGKLNRDEYDAPLETHFAADQVLPMMSAQHGKKWDVLLPDLFDRLSQAEIAPQVTLKNEARPWGVQWMAAKTTDGIVVNLYNASNDAVKISVERDGKAVELIDLLTDQKLDPAKPLEPMEVHLCRVVE